MALVVHAILANKDDASIVLENAGTDLGSQQPSHSGLVGSTITNIKICQKTASAIRWPQILHPLPPAVRTQLLTNTSPTTDHQRQKEMC